MRIILSVLFTLALAAPAQAGNLIPGTNCPAFKDDTYFHADISQLPRHPRSNAWMASMNSAHTDLHPDFGPSFGDLPNDMPYGIPITVVDGSQGTVSVAFQYANESDNVPYPLGAWTKVEGGQYQSGDRHTVTVDRATCRLYETWATRRQGNAWSAGSGAVWDLNAYTLRPNGWTSADAAGLPILPLLLRFEEVQARNIDHAIRFTAALTARRYLWPARHQAGDSNSQDVPPMGARFRLKRNFRISGYRADTRAVLRAMKTYGLVLADNGSNWFFQGTADPRWNNDMLDELKSIPAGAFEAVDTLSLMMNRNSMRVRVGE